MKMHAWQVHNWGEPESMQWAEVEVPEPQSGQVRIRNRAAGLNFFDILQVQGKYQIKPPFPFTPGAEVAGEIDAVGPGVTEFRPGDPVLALTHGSGLAGQTIVDSAQVFPLPQGLDWPQAAAMPVVYHTSWYALKDRANLQPREWLLVHAAASGTGMSAIQIGHALGARIIATAGSPEKLEFARRQGAHHTLLYTDPSWVDQVKEITAGRGADVIYDPVGGDVFDLSTKCIAGEGRLLVIGFASGRIPTIAANRILIKGMSVVGVLWGGRLKADKSYAAATQRALDALWREGKIRPEVSRIYPLSQAPQALRDLADRKIHGKAVLQCP